MKLKKIIYRKAALVLVLIFCLSAVSCTGEKDDGIYTVSFDYGYGDKVLTEQVEDGSLIAAPDAPMRIGYEFDGWWIVAEDEEWQWDFENNIVLENVTLYARWKESSAKPYILKLDPNGGTCSAEQVEVYYNQEYSLPIPKKEGYYFFGWMYMPKKMQIATEGVYPYTYEMNLVAAWRDYPANTIIKMGKFEQDNVLSNGPEELEWQIVKHENGKYLLISRHILTTMPWRTPDTIIMDWTSSQMSVWLNGEFYETVFSEEEKEYIYLKDIYDPNEGKIFCPDERHIKDDVIEEAIIRCEPTPYAIAMGVKGYSIENFDGSMQKRYTYYSLEGGTVETPTGYFSGVASTVGVRPVMWVNEEFVESFIK